MSLHGVCKSYDGVLALSGVDLEIEPATVHALVGANGAGKSTLGKIIAGAVSADEGHMMVGGRPVHFRSPADALREGVAIVQQEIALAPDLTVLQNVCLGVERSRLRPKGPSDRDLFDSLLLRTGFAIEPDAVVGGLRIAEQQKVSVLWALARRAQLIVFDEPTAALDRAEAAKLLETIKDLRAAGISIIYVSHFLDEVLDVADTITVLASGRHVWTQPRAGLHSADLVHGMLGQSLDAAFPQLGGVPDRSPVALLAEGLSDGGVLVSADIEVRQGEIHGIYGLVGSGRSEFAHAMAGASQPAAGTVRLNGHQGAFRSPRHAIEAGVVLLPENRKDQGLLLDQCQSWNATLAALPKLTPKGFIRARAEREAAIASLEAMSVTPLDLDAFVGGLSGGNQQKVLFAKCLSAAPKVLILDEPTRGVDIGAKRSIYDVIVKIAAAGTAVILISSEHDEVIRMSHRITVMRGGRTVAHFDKAEATATTLMRSALGVAHPTLQPESRKGT
ncbi:MAG: ribose transport system ATP-binding protein [Nocardioidaceae bacterium]|jgi:ABC-type sugar transport system ATPase subunit|nr:ribose transport system ATP-binding protein [Nocardioidaceae bacterium]